MKTITSKVKSVSFTSTARAHYVHDQAVQVLKNHKEKNLVKIMGNIVVVPVWFPVSAN